MKSINFETVFANSLSLIYGVLLWWFMLWVIFVRLRRVYAKLCELCNSPKKKVMKQRSDWSKSVMTWVVLLFMRYKDFRIHIDCSSSRGPQNSVTKVFGNHSWFFLGIRRLLKPKRLLRVSWICRLSLKARRVYWKRVL